MNIEHALTVEGWMMESELEYLSLQASRSHSICEVGSWMGRSTSALAANTPGLVIAVDSWKGSEEHQGELSTRPEGWLLGQFLQNTSCFDNIWPLQSLALDAARLIKKGPFRFDLIFIDANHDYASVKADIQAWTPLLTSGGIICGHDYDPPNWMGVHDAVHECVPRFRVVPGTTIWTTEEA